ncbi:N-acetylmuramoyl-L-alanine amidase [Conchiformibius steedae]|uniref:N-acetylmuramoyl-L-alanine amidase n=1 Tax=Conchiformibius steedae TaxID=153493 RepID=A0A3P2A4D5_9NEIS|nr:N-acetylmuramoyl-L-alanine amidase [Conchiformibius steedae]RRD90312.1 N-acetylmuramoyl-L-alanine amidase [Conchiformibius steedae]
MAKLSRRLLLGASAGGLLVMALGSRAAGNRFLAVRIASGSGYTRVSLESDDKVRYKYFMLENPYRLVVDVEDADLNAVLSNMGGKLPANDPYIANIRTAQKDSKTVRIVFDLKRRVLPKVFGLQPEGNMKHRLVVDLYPVAGTAAKTGSDPIQTFWQNRKKNQEAKDYAENTPTVKRGHRPLVMLDPGHGGKDPGATGRSGLREKDVVLHIAKETKKHLESMGYQVVLTRNNDTFIPVLARPMLARRAKADVFVSIHADSVPNPEPRGGGVYVLNQKGASDEASRLLAESENAAGSDIGGVQISNANKDVNQVLMNMVQTQTINDSKRLARLMLNHLAKHNRTKNQVNFANFGVLRAPEIPAVLVETAFLSNPQDEALLSSSEFRRKIAHAIAEGIRQYLGAAVLARR